MKRGRSEFKDTWGRELQDYGGRTKGKMLKMEVVDDDDGVLFLFFFWQDVLFLFFFIYFFIHFN